MKNIIIFLFISLIIPLFASAEGGGAPFLPTWKLMSQRDREQFVAGYIQGWRDASSFTDIAIQYVQESPNEALDSLIQLRKVYEVKDLRPALMSEAINDFFKDSSNENAPLSQAVSYAKQVTTGN